MANSNENMSDSSSPFLINDLPDRLLLLILCRLPRLSSYSSRYVCKCWLALISTASFDQNYYNPFAFVKIRGYNPNTREFKEFLFGYDVSSANLAFKTPASSLCFLPGFEEDEEKPIEVMSFNKQFLLCRRDSTYYICCPITKEWVSIPCCPCYDVPSWQAQFGFIFDSFSRYIVLRLSVTCGLTGNDLDIFSSATSTWTHVEAPERTNSKVISYDGKVVWWTEDGYRGVVMYDPYNVENPRNYSFIDKPADMLDKYNPYLSHLENYRGSLRLCQIHRKPNKAPKPESLMVWKLKDPYGEGDQWTLEHNISFKKLVNDHQEEEDYDVFSWLAFDPNNEDILYLVLNHRNVVSCNLRTKTIDAVVVSESQSRYSYLKMCF